MRFRASRRLRQLLNGGQVVNGRPRLENQSVAKPTLLVEIGIFSWMSLYRSSGWYWNKVNVLPKVVSEIQLYTVLLLHLLIQNKSVDIPECGRLYVSENGRRKNFRFKAKPSVNLGGNRSNMSGIKQLYSYKAEQYFHPNEGGRLYSKYVLSLENAQKMVQDLEGKDNPFLCARTLSLLLRGEGPSVSLPPETRVYLEDAYQTLAVEASQPGQGEKQ